MKALILAGGFGTRLRTVVQNIPKVMAPVREIPFLEYLLEHLHKHAFTETLISVHYLAHHIKNYFGDNYKGMNIRYIEENAPLGTGGAIKHSMSFTQDTKNILVMNGDSFTNCNLKEIFEQHAKSDSKISILVKHMPISERYGTLEISNEIVRSFEEKSQKRNCYINTGIYVLRNDIFLDYSLPEAFSFEQDFLQKKVDQLQIRAIPTDGFFIDIGIPEDYNRAQIDLEKIL